MFLTLGGSVHEGADHCVQCAEEGNSSPQLVLSCITGLRDCQVEVVVEVEVGGTADSWGGFSGGQGTSPL